MEQLQTWWVTALYMPIDGDSCMEIPGDCEVVKAADAQATIAALQAQLHGSPDSGMGLVHIADDLKRQRDDLQAQLTQRTAELARVRKKLGETKLYLQQERANRDSLVACVNRDVKTIKELRTLTLALPKVEGEILEQGDLAFVRYVHVDGPLPDIPRHDLIALLKHRQGME